VIYITVVGNVVSHLTYMYLHSSGHFSLHHMLSRDIAVRYITIVLNKTTVLVLCSLHQTVAFRLAWYRICMDLHDQAVLKLVCCIDLCKDKVDVLLGAKPCDVLFVIACHWKCHCMSLQHEIVPPASGIFRVPFTSSENWAAVSSSLPSGLTWLLRFSLRRTQAEKIWKAHKSTLD